METTRKVQHRLATLPLPNSEVVTSVRKLVQENFNKTQVAFLTCETIPVYKYLGSHGLRLHVYHLQYTDL